MFAQPDTDAESQLLGGHSGTIRALAISPDGKFLASGGKDETVHIWERHGQGFEEKITLTTDRITNGLAFSADGHSLFEAGERIRDKDNVLGVWIASAVTFSQRILQDTWNVDVNAIAVSQKTKLLACGMGDKNVLLVNGVTLKPLSKLEGHTGEVQCVAFNKEGTLLASGSDDGAVLLWNTATSRLQATLSGHGDDVRAIAFHPAGKILASAGNDRTITLWNITSKSILKTLQGHTDDVLGLAFSADGKLLASCGADNTVRLWSVDSGVEIRTCIGHEDAVYAVAFTPSGDLLASAGADKSVRLWTVAKRTTRSKVIAERIEASPDLAVASPRGGVKIALLEPSPSRGMKIVQKQDKANIKGKVSGGAVQKVYVNDEEAKLSKNGEFALLLPLEEGENTLRIRAVDRTNNSTEETFTVTREVPAQRPQGGVSQHGTDYALLIATDDYDEWKPLTNPVNDAKAIGGELRTSYGFDTDVLADATQSEMLTTLRKYAGKKYAEGDQLVIFIAGHGQFDEVLGDGYIVCKDSRLHDDVKTSYISHSTLRTVINNIPCKHILLLVDACFGGTFDPLIAAADRGEDEYSQVTKTEFIERKLRFKTRRFLTSGGKEYVPDGRPGQHSPFTRRLLEAFRSYGGKDGVLTLGEIMLYVETVKPEPRAGEFGTNDPGSDFLFIAR
jgi:WD40 repeat protein